MNLDLIRNRKANVKSNTVENGGQPQQVEQVVVKEVQEINTTQVPQQNPIFSGTAEPVDVQLLYRQNPGTNYQQQQPQYSQPVVDNRVPVMYDQKTGEPLYEGDPRIDVYRRRSLVNTGSLAVIDKELTVEELKQHVVDSLNIIGEEIVVYQPPHANVKARDFEIRDTNGVIAARLEEIEKETGLSVIPFKVAGLTNFVKEILGYCIFEKDGEKYATSNSHIVNQAKLDSILLEFDNELRQGFVVNKDIMIEYDYKGVVYKLPMFNQYEIGYICATYRNYGAVAYEIDNVTHIAVGI